MQAYTETLARLRDAVQQTASAQVMQMLDMLQDAVSSKQRTEQELRGLMADKDGETVRLRAEIGRLRHAAQQSEKLQEAHATEVNILQAQLAQAQLASKAAERSAVLSTAVPAAATPHGELLKLQAELDARGALVARLEAELSAQAAAASARAAELQDSFALKVADMRRVHAQQLAELEHGYQQQVASAQAMAVAGQQEASADVQALKQQLQACNRELADTQSRLAAQQQASERLSMQLAQLQADVGQATEDKLQAARTAQYLRGEVDKLKAALSAAESRASSAEEAAAVTRAGSSQGAPAAAAAAADMNAMVSMMEGQLARLSDIIRVKESEISELRLALTLGLEERRELVGQVQALQAKVQSAGAPVAPKGEGSPWSVTSGSAAVGPGGDRSPGSRGKPALGMSQQYLGSGASAPYRTGLHSKPKFK